MQLLHFSSRTLFIKFLLYYFALFSVRTWVIDVHRYLENGKFLRFECLKHWCEQFVRGVRQMSVFRFKFAASEKFFAALSLFDSHTNNFSYVPKFRYRKIHKKLILIYLPLSASLYSIVIYTFVHTIFARLYLKSCSIEKKTRTRQNICTSTEQ